MPNQRYGYLPNVDMSQLLGRNSSYPISSRSFCKVMKLD